MTAHTEDPEALRLALALMKHGVMGDRDLALKLINGTDPEWTRRLLIAQTDNAVRLCRSLFWRTVAKLAEDLGTDPEEYMRRQLDALILGLAAKETEEG